MDAAGQVRRHGSFWARWGAMFQLRSGASGAWRTVRLRESVAFREFRRSFGPAAEVVSFCLLPGSLLVASFVQVSDSTY
ncbi:hypothetical protein L6452_10560 [Arctium lappa]|uniref:Uncharacterized protein n=1 Tax=Arctium lappa TaxID=4217 RepID=A0ACB9DN42_ARCLA|nr:hypothetical protein L6452_10560 [Arctium lappa]